MRERIHLKVSLNEGGLYLALLFPITVAFLLTFAGSRVVSHLAPELFIIVSGVHVHHFAYGILVLATSGYLALTFSTARAKYLLSLLYGFGLGLAFDEFGMWLHLQDEGTARWSYDGFMLVLGTFLFIISAKTGIKLLKKLWPFSPASEP